MKRDSGERNGPVAKRQRQIKAPDFRAKVRRHAADRRRDELSRNINDTIFENEQEGNCKAGDRMAYDGGNGILRERSQISCFCKVENKLNVNAQTPIKCQEFPDPQNDDR
jgi:hypothetical protein